MRHESEVVSLSWIPSEVVPGLNKLIFGSGFTHYDPPPPALIDDLDALRQALPRVRDGDEGEVRPTGERLQQLIRLGGAGHAPLINGDPFFNHQQRATLLFHLQQDREAVVFCLGLEGQDSPAEAGFGGLHPLQTDLGEAEHFNPAIQG